jgi:hypothetical protein
MPIRSANRHFVVIYFDFVQGYLADFGNVYNKRTMDSYKIITR